VAAAGRPVEEHRGEHPGDVRGEVARVEVAPKRQLSQPCLPDRVERRCVVQLAELHGETESDGRDGASSQTDGRRDRRDRPEDHARPQRVTKDVSRNGRKNTSITMHGEADADRPNDERDVTHPSAKPARLAALRSS
jgi:hypothetical protein